MAEPRRLTELVAVVEEVTDLPDGPLVVALSGGADSAALLHMCCRLERKVRAVHVHHGFGTSDMMAGAASAVASHLGVDLRVVEVDVCEGASPEDQARRARYAALEGDVAGDEWVLTAHTSDDQAETVIHHLLRASGIDGLKGIPSRRPPFARPFLGVTRSQTRELATLAGLRWVDDPANDTLDPLRNRIRRQLIPTLEASYNRRLRQSLATTALLVATDIDHLEAQLRPGIVPGDETTIPASVLATASPSPAARMARRFLAAAGLASASPGAVAGVLAVAEGRIDRHQPGAGLVVRRRGALVVATGAEQPTPPALDLVLAGETRYGDWTFESFVMDRPPVVMPLGAAWMVADADAATRWRLEPASGHPDALEHLAASSVPAEDRSRHPVLVADGEAVWLPMVRRLAFGWADADTERYLVVRT